MPENLQTLNTLGTLVKFGKFYQLCDIIHVNYPDIMSYQD